MTEWLTLPLYLFFCVIIFVFVMLFICYDSFTCVFIVFIIFGKVLAIISLNSYLVLYSRDSNYTYFNCLMLFYSPFIFIFLSLSFSLSREEKKNDENGDDNYQSKWDQFQKVNPDKNCCSGKIPNILGLWSLCSQRTECMCLVCFLCRGVHPVDTVVCRGTMCGIWAVLWGPSRTLAFFFFFCVSMNDLDPLVKYTCLVITKSYQMACKCF